MKTLSELARERKLAKEKGIKTAGTGSVTVAKPGVVTNPSVPQVPQEKAAPGKDDLHVYVESVDHNDTVSASGQTTVFGKVRNAGDIGACGLRVAVRVYDERGTYLSSGEAAIDQSQVGPGESVSFQIAVQVPPGVAGRLRDRANSQNRGTTVAGGTIEGNWRYLGRAEGEIRNASPCAGEPRTEPEPAPEPAPQPTPQPTPKLGG
jgi:hypothetical protein